MDILTLRQERCRDCTCKDRKDIKELKKLKQKVKIGAYGVAFAYAILCGIAAAMVCVVSGVGTPFLAICGIFGGAVCALWFGVIADASIQDIIDDIHWTMDKLGCGCAIYC